MLGCIVDASPMEKRHSNSSSVEVRFSIDEREARLEVKDYGKGIDPDLLHQFNKTDAGAGIGLAGMRERVRELGGRLEVQSDATGHPNLRGDSYSCVRSGQDIEVRKRGLKRASQGE